MTLSLPSADEIDQYSRRPEPPSQRRSLVIPLIADDEAVCQVRVLETGSGAYWSRGDVDVHVLHARQHGIANNLAQQAWLASALRERREQRRRLLHNGVRTTAGGLVVLNAPAQLIVPNRT